MISRLLQLNSSITVRTLRVRPGYVVIFRQLREPDGKIGEGCIAWNHVQKMFRIC